MYPFEHVYVHIERRPQCQLGGSHWGLRMMRERPKVLSKMRE